MLSARDLDITYGAVRATRGVSFSVPDGQIVALLGSNGAGKSSLLRAVAGLVPVAAGSMEWDTRDLRPHSAEERVVMGIGTVPEGRALFRSLSVRENLMMGAYRRHDRNAARADLDWVLQLFPVLAERQRSVAGTLSGGQAQMLSIGRALMGAPRLLLLDEPSHGLAPKVVDELFALIPQLARERKLTVLLVEQNAARALTVSSYGYVLETGTVALEGPTEALARDERVRALYLGG